MNYKKHILLFLAVMSLLSCSHDETIVQKRNEISFAVRTQSASRGEVVTTSGINRSGEKFNVWGYYREAADATQQIYMNELLTHNGTEWTLGGTRYWPQSGLMDFYCVYPIDSKNTENGALGNGNGEFDYVVSTDLSKQDDLLYAAAIGEQRMNKLSVSPVNLNFRHALSQIVYSVGVGEDCGFRVKVKEITVCGLKDQGRFAMPKQSTSEPNYSNAPDGSNPTEIEDKGWGKWTLEDDAVATYVNYALPAATQTNGDDHLTVGEYNKTSKSVVRFSDSRIILDDDPNNSRPLLLLPQTRDKAVLDGSVWKNGVYFKILCRVDVMAADGVTEVQLWPDNHSMIGEDYYDYLYIPVDVSWKQGCKYKYTFIFNGSLFDVIQFTVTVDEYQSADDTELIY